MQSWLGIGVRSALVITPGPGGTGGAGVPNGRGQALLSVRWIGRPWRTLGGGPTPPPGGIGEPIIRPGGFGTSRSNDNAVIVFPQPDSPTIANVSALCTEKDTSSTALTTPSRVNR